MKMKCFFSPSTAAVVAVLVASSITITTYAAPAYTAELYHNLPPLSDINHNTTKSGFVSALDRLFFIHDNELYTLGYTSQIFAGTSGGAVVSDLNINADGGGKGGISYSNFGEGDASYAIMNDELYFFAGDDEKNADLWKTDGTEGGTVLVKDINSVASNGVALSSKIGPPQIANYKDQLYYYEFDDKRNPTLYISDGTEEGSVPVNSTNSPLPESTIITYITEFDGKTYFPAEGDVCQIFNGTTTCETDTALFVLEDGGEATQFANLSSSILTHHDGTEVKMKVYNDLLYFQTTEDGMYRTDGTPEGTFALPVDGGHYTAGSDSLLFTCAEIGEKHQKSICETDGTVEGTFFIANVSSSNGFEKGLTPIIGDKILFHNRKKRNDVIKPHVFDPTEEEEKKRIYILDDLDTTDEYSTFVMYQDVAFFKAEDEDSALGSELYATDGTKDGTVLVKDVNVGSIGSNIRSLEVFGDDLYFIAYTNDSGNDIWKVTPCPETGCPTPSPTPVADSPVESPTFAGTVSADGTSQEIGTDSMPWSGEENGLDGTTVSSPNSAVKVSNFYFLIGQVVLVYYVIVMAMF